MQGMQIDVHAQQRQEKDISRIFNLYIGPDSPLAGPSQRCATWGTPLSPKVVVVVDMDGSAIAHVWAARPSHATRKRRVSDAKMSSANKDQDFGRKERVCQKRRLVLA